ncbi:TIGR00730 family Rossman fold protein [Actinomadura graeca]|uniref:Cytokinin riboside 5'-monophosphate phosphoribohydrolase n=1 Tax=Actinomadura graeca TaxID=2750812 RepID=A0ABX8QS70_9ACTN|nr:TIGR00730 family Rossman fold protein [Actinomadura graeca]QXJ21483.1 TIGR00730 family Rossman fold protein [Actinomadura graeca]
MLDEPRQPSRIGVFCGARPGVDRRYVDFATDFGAVLARRGAGLVYGAGGVGIMGAVAAAADAGGAAVTGVIPHRLHERERGTDARGRIFIVRSMHARKALMYRLSSGFAVLPGGFGTLDGLLEVATWNQLGLHRKPLVLANHNGFFDPLLEFFDHIVREGFLAPAERTRIQVADDPEDVLDRLTGETQSDPP